jgi:hypothetical protein
VRLWTIGGSSSSRCAFSSEFRLSRSASGSGSRLTVPHRPFANPEAIAAPTQRVVVDRGSTSLAIPGGGTLTATSFAAPAPLYWPAGAGETVDALC